MKTFARVFLATLTGLLLVSNADAQSGKFTRKWDFNSIDGIPTAYTAYTSLTTKYYDPGLRGEPQLF